MTADARPPVVVAEFAEDDRGPRRGVALVEAARAAGATWVATRVGADVAGLRATARAAADAGVGLFLRLDDTRAILDLEDALADLGERSVPALRERLVVVVATERAGKRLRTDAAWAPSAVDLGEFTGFLAFLRRAAPNRLRAACLVDDLVMPRDHLPPPRLARAAAKLRTRGGRLWLTGLGPGDVTSVPPGLAHGVVVRPHRA